MKEGPGNSGPLVYIFKAEEEMHPPLLLHLSEIHLTYFTS